MSERIISNPTILGGKPIISGTRISVEIVLEWMASGASREEILRGYPFLTSEDLDAVFAYAASAMKNEIHLAVPVAS
jgi:uncharacterized protein (DUF433 family)